MERNSGERLKYIETFHPREYQKLLSNGQREHSLIEWKGCESKFSNEQATLAVNLNPKHNKNMDIENVFAITLKENTQQIYNIVNKPFEKKYGISFAESMTNIKELNQNKKGTEENS